MGSFNGAWWRSQIRDSFRAGSSGRNVLTLLSGTAIAQLVTVGFLVPLARLYSPTDLGLFALFQAVVSFGVTVAALRYDLAVVLPESEADARVLLRLARFSIAVVAGMMIVAGFLLRGAILTWFGSALLADWFFLSGVAVFLIAQISGTQLWLTRAMRFRSIAQNRLLAGAGVGVFQVAAFYLFSDVRGLMLGLVAGQLLAAVVITMRTPSARSRLPGGAPSMRVIARRYMKMPLLNGPNALVDSARTVGINSLIGASAVAGLGHYSLAWQFTMAPAGLVQGSIAQVLLQRMAVAESGSLTRLVRRVLVRIAVVAVPTFALFYALAPLLFGWILGPAWREAGVLARGLTPWVFMLTFTSPLSNIFIVTERQQWMLLFSVIYTIVPLAFLSAGPKDLLTAVPILGWMMSGLLVMLVIMALLVARRFDG